MAFALLVDLSVGLEWRPTEPTHMLSNIYKCHRAKAFHTSIFCEDPSYNEPVGLLKPFQVIVTFLCAFSCSTKLI